MSVLSIFFKFLFGLYLSRWGQISILTALAEYQPMDEKDAANICDKVIPRLQHANGSVVLCAIRVLLTHLHFFPPNEDYVANVLRKMTPPMVTLLAAPPEIQYVALRNIRLVLQQQPSVMQNELRVFFCRYNDPLYVKLEKLECLTRLVSTSNYEQLLSELKDYATEVDADFVRRAVRTIGRCGVKVEASAERCVDTLLEIIHADNVAEHVVQESVCVFRDILRRYPHQFDSIIPSSLTTTNIVEQVADATESKAALIWIIGEYAEKIDSAGNLLDSYADGFMDEPVAVQLQIVSAVVKLFLRRPSVAQDLLVRVLQTAAQGCDHPDLRDRAYIYWRLLSSDPQTASKVVLAERPKIQDVQETVPRPVLERLIRELGSVASVHHKVAETFLGTGRLSVEQAVGASVPADILRRASAAQVHIPQTEDEIVKAAEAQVVRNTVADLLDLEYDVPSSTVGNVSASTASMDWMQELQSGGGLAVQQPVASSAPSNTLNDLLGDFAPSPPVSQSNATAAIQTQTMNSNSLLDLL